MRCHHQKEGECGYVFASILYKVLMITTMMIKSVAIALNTQMVVKQLEKQIKTS